GDANAIRVQVEVESGGTITSGQLSVTAETSFDLDNWEALSISGAMLTAAPEVATFGTDYSGGGSLRAPYARVRYTNSTGIDLMVSARLRLFSL
ncbi:MAG: hypothetical protein KC549_04200, partial [Myxococcales bacterium]|nr:hypothetical protein [Myxococcales bacterium]